MKYGKERKRQWLFGAIAALFVTGLGLVGNGLYIKAKAQVAQVLLDRAWTRSLQTGTPQKAWPWADTHPVAAVNFPTLGERTIVLAGESGEALAFGPAYLSSSTMVGQPGTAVFAAHRDTHFRALKWVSVGDEIEVTDRQGKKYIFGVTRSRVARWDNSGIAADGLEPRLALVTCWPFDAQTPGPWRYIVEAELVPELQR